MVRPHPSNVSEALILYFTEVLNDTSTYVRFTQTGVVFDGGLDLREMGERLSVLISEAIAHVPETWPVGAEERAQFKDWQHEVANGDTVLGFRDWLAHGEEANRG